MCEIIADTNQDLSGDSQIARVSHMTDGALTKDQSIKKARDPFSFEELSVEFDKCVQHLKKPECDEVLSHFFDHEHKVNITQCICLALGNFGARRKKSKDCVEFTDSLHQLAVLTVLLQVLKTKNNISNVYFQDPKFQPVEVQFLQALGYIVLENPDAFEKMTASTFLFAPYCPYDVAFGALKSSFPVLYVGNDPGPVRSNIIHGPSGSEPTRAIQVETFFRFHLSTKGHESTMMMPLFDRQQWLAGTQVRWLHSDRKYFEKGFAGVVFLPYRVCVLFLLFWKRIWGHCTPEEEIW